MTCQTLHGQAVIKIKYIDLKLLLNNVLDITQSGSYQNKIYWFQTITK